MPIKPGETENEDEFISRCMGIETEDYEQDQAYAICKSKWDNRMSEEVSEESQQGGVVSAGFGKTKFMYPVKRNEKLNEYMSRCMSDSLVREKKPDRGVRAGFCYTNYQNKYIMSIGKKWK